MNRRSLDTEVTSPYGFPAPVAWEWNTSDIIDYVQCNRQEVLETLRSRNADVKSCGLLIDDVLLQCLNENMCYSSYLLPKSSPKQKDIFRMTTVVVPFLNHPSVPISDVFQALGWFISYAERRTTDVEILRRRLLCYTRLCVKIGTHFASKNGLSLKKANAIYPKMTHMLVVGKFTVFSTSSSEANLQLMASYSSSLPKDSGGRKYEEGFAPKTMVTDARAGLIIGLGGRYKGIGEDIRDRNDMGLPPFDLGSCAETLNIICHHEGDRRIYGLGQALSVKELNESFKTYDYHLNKASVDACENCQYLFKNGTVHQTDVSTGAIFGKLPSSFTTDPKWAERQTSACKICQKVTTSLYPCQDCGKPRWCSKACYSNDRWHSAKCRGRQHMGGPQSSLRPPRLPQPESLTHIPALPAYPPPELATRSAYYNIYPQPFLSPSHPIGRKSVQANQAHFSGLQQMYPNDPRYTIPY